MQSAAIIILNWNGKKYLQKCLESVFVQSYSTYVVYFVDNNSQDDSVAFVKKSFSKYVKSGKLVIVQNHANYGFCEGNNIGIRHALRDGNFEYIVLLNNDTFVDKDWLESLVKAAQKDSTIGMVASKTLRLDGSVDTLGLRANIAGFGYDIKKEHDIDTLIGPCGVSALYKRDLLKSVKYNDDYFDRDFFCYSEDLDIALRAQKKGWKAVYARKSIVHHVHGGSASSSFSLYHVHRNNVWVAIKNFSMFKLIVLSPIIIGMHIASVLKYSFSAQMMTVIKAKIDACKKFHIMWRKRKAI